MWRVVGVLGFGLALSACHQNGTVFAVDTTDDTIDATPGDGLCADANGDCSLRAAVLEANALPGVEEIRLGDGLTYELTLPGGLNIRAAVVVTGDGTIHGDGGEPAVSVDSPGFVEFDGPDFLGGFHGLVVEGGSSVSVRHADFRSAPVLVEDGVLSIWSSSFDVSRGIGIRVLDGRVHMENTSMLGSSNSTDLLRADGGDVQVVSSTLSHGDIHGSAGASGGSVMVQSSVLDVDCAVNVVSLGHNLGQGDCHFGEPGDVEGSEYPVTRRLADSGGETLTLHLDPFGAGVDAGKAAACTLTNRDARGVVRPHGSACDIGAMELEVGADCGAPGPGADLRFCDFRDADLAGFDLSGADASDAHFKDADLTGATLIGTVFTRATLIDSLFTDANLTEADMSLSFGGFYADGADFTRAMLDGVSVNSAIGADFTDASARGFSTYAFTASMAGANVEGADFTDASFWGVTSGGVTGTATFSPGIGLVEGYIIDRYVDLSGVDFSDADLSEIGLWGAEAQGANFAGATLTLSVTETDFEGATLDGADLSGTYGWFAEFADASVVGVDFTGAEMYATTWTDAMIVGSDFTDATLWGGRFRDAVMSLNIFDNTTCPSGMNSDDNGGNCDGQFDDGEPLPPSE